MEQQPPSRSTPQPPPPPAAPRGRGPAPGSSEAQPADSQSDAGVVRDDAGPACPVCKEPRADDARFCEECGHDFEGDAPAPPPRAEEKSGFSGPILWLVLVFWVVLAVGGLIFLYTALWSL